MNELANFYRRPLFWFIVALLIAFVGIAPFCDWLFRCGCDWPWQGWADNCNAFIPNSPERCPWCVE